MNQAIQVRPFQLLCLFCAVGKEIPGERGVATQRLRAAIRVHPDVPITLRCNAMDVYVYQDPGTADDAPEGAEFCRKRDLDILCALDLAPGSTLPARTLLYRVLRAIPTACGICGCGTAPAAWRGCPRAEEGSYERGLAGGIEALVPPRCPEEMRREKRVSVAAMQSGVGLRIRPHVAMCAVCQFGNADGEAVPLAADNIVEFIQIIRERPEVPVTMAQGADWMICAPCGRRVPTLNACVNVYGSGGLSNEKRDLDVLQVLGLSFGAQMPGREFLRLLFERLPTTQPICRRDSPALSVWWDGCGESNRAAGNAGYAKGRELLLREWAGPDGTD